MGHREGLHRRGALAAALALALVVLLGCSATDTNTANTTGTADTTDTTEESRAQAASPARTPSADPGVQSPTTPTARHGRAGRLPRAEFAPQGRYAVGREDLVLVDPTRGTAAHAGEAPRPDRTLPVRMLYPRAGEAGSEVADGAEALLGQFPLVVFSHGLGSNAAEYEELMGAVAAAGYVVAMPTYPLSSGAGGSYLDVVNQPEDISFVIDSLLALSGRSLGGAIDRERIAVAGHSLGAVTSVGVTFHDRLHDDRIDAAIGYAGAQFDLGAGGYTDRPTTPLLLVHGTADRVLGVGQSRAIFKASTGRVDFLRLKGAGHVDLFYGDDGRLVLDATIAFLDAHLHGRRQALAALPRETRQSGFAAWRSRS